MAPMDPMARKYRRYWGLRPWLGRHLDVIWLTVLLLGSSTFGALITHL